VGGVGGWGCGVVWCGDCAIVTPNCGLAPWAPDPHPFSPEPPQVLCHAICACMPSMRTALKSPRGNGRGRDEAHQTPQPCPRGPDKTHTFTPLCFSARRSSDDCLTSYLQKQEASTLRCAGAQRGPIPSATVPHSARGRATNNQRPGTEHGRLLRTRRTSWSPVGVLRRGNTQRRT
jgi:hypothetical protein